MLSTGNDIIALNLINKERSNDSRFYSKIITPAEKEIYDLPAVADNIAFEHFLWLCWSVKESAYKYLKRNNPALSFSPTKIIIQQLAIEENVPGEKSCSGNFILEGTTVYFRSRLNKEFIATVVKGDENFEKVSWGIQTINDTTNHYQSKAVRSFFLDSVQDFFPGKNLTIEKAGAGYPVVSDGTTELAFPVSFAHHGRYIAYSFSFS